MPQKACECRFTHVSFHFYLKCHNLIFGLFAIWKLVAVFFIRNARFSMVGYKIKIENLPSIASE